MALWGWKGLKVTVLSFNTFQVNIDGGTPSYNLSAPARDPKDRERERTYSNQIDSFCHHDILDS